MTNILSLLGNKDAIVAFVSNYVKNNNRPCPTEAIYEKFGEIKDTITLMKMQGDVVGLRGRNGGLVAGNEYDAYMKASNDRKADKVVEKTGKKRVVLKNVKKIKSSMLNPRVKTVTPDPFPAIPAIPAISAPAAALPPLVDSKQAVADIQNIVSDFKKKTKRTSKKEKVDPIPSIDDSDVVETKGYDDEEEENDDKDAVHVIEETTHDSRFDDEQDEEFNAMISDIEGTIDFNRFSEEE